MSFNYSPNQQLFDEGVLIKSEDHPDIRVQLFGLYGKCDGRIIIPCRYKSILSYRNGIARAIDLAGRLVYITENGEQLFDPQFPFVPELCEDFDEDGKAKIACLVNCFVIEGTMDDDGTMHLKNYNE